MTLKKRKTLMKNYCPQKSKNLKAVKYFKASETIFKGSRKNCYKTSNRSTLSFQSLVNQCKTEKKRTIWIIWLIKNIYIRKEKNSTDNPVRNVMQ